MPKQTLHAGGNFKVRINWWSGVCGYLNLALSSGLINDEIVKNECEAFLGKYAGQDYWEGGAKRTTKEDIDEANTVLEKVVENLQNST